MTGHPQQSVHLRIQRLVLEGLRLDARQAGAVHRATETELAALLTAGPPARLDADSSRARPPGAAPRIDSWSDPADLGRQVARAVYDGMGR